MMATWVRARDGVKTWVSGWSAWRANLGLIKRRPCHGCDGTGRVLFTRTSSDGARMWTSRTCRLCDGTGRGKDIV